MKEVLRKLPESERRLLRAQKQPEWLSPTLATLVHEPFNGPDWLFEPKFDGERCLFSKQGKRVRIMSPNRTPLNETYPELLDAIAEQPCDDLVVDAEIVAFDGGVTATRSSSSADTPSLPGFGTASAHFWLATTTRSVLCTRARSEPVSPKTRSPNSENKLSDRRRQQSPFDGGLGERQARWVRPELVTQVEFTEWTGDGKLRHPSFLGLRRDKDPTDVTRERAL